MGDKSYQGEDKMSKYYNSLFQFILIIIIITLFILVVMFFVDLVTSKYIGRDLFITLIRYTLLVIMLVTSLELSGLLIKLRCIK